LTIRELFQEFVIAKRKARSDFNAQMTQTWYGAVLPLQKKIKPLKAYLLNDRSASSMVQSPAELMSAMYQIAAAHGLRVRTVQA